MLLRRRILGRILWCTVLLTLLGVAYVMFTGNRDQEAEKLEANRITSPWDLSDAPPPYIDRSQVKVKAPEANGQKRGAKQNAGAKQAQGSRIADSRTGANRQRGR